MQLDDCFFIGYTHKSANKKGQIQIALEVDSPEQYFNMAQVFVQLDKTDDEAVPFFIESIKPVSNNRVSIQFEDIYSIEDAELLCSKSVFLSLSELPELLGNKFYFHEIIGFEIWDKIYGRVGIIEKVEKYPANPVFVVKSNERELLIPVVQEIIELVDRKNKKIEMDMPDGLIELYLQS